MQSLLKEAGFLAETDKMIPKFLLKFKESRIAKQSQKKTEQNWRTHTTWFPNSLQSYSNQDSVVLRDDTRW